MRFRMQHHEESTSVAVRADERWVPLRSLLTPEKASDVVGAELDDLVGILAGGAPVRERIRELCGSVAVGEESPWSPQLPFRPASMRCFAEWEAHWLQAARELVRRYHPVGHLAARLIAGYESLTRRTFPPLRPGKEFYAHPTYYIGNHLNVVTDGETVPWPCFCRDLDFELELGAIVVRPLLDAGPREALEAIGGFVVVNDFSARDTQWREYTDGQFGPVVKTKGFATAVGAEVVSPDEVLPWIDDLAATVSVNGEEWSRTSTAGMQHGIGEMVAWASRGEQLHPGELLATGTMPRGCGLELDRWLAEGDVVRLDVSRIGSLTNRIGRRDDAERRGHAQDSPFGVEVP